MALGKYTHGEYFWFTQKISNVYQITPQTGQRSKWTTENAKVCVKGKSEKKKEEKLKKNQKIRKKKNIKSHTVYFFFLYNESFFIWKRNFVFYVLYFLIESIFITKLVAIKRGLLQDINWL